MDSKCILRTYTHSHLVFALVLIILASVIFIFFNLILIPSYCLCLMLQDSTVMVRRHALILLTQLLLQDFIKWRGLLLFRFLATAIGTYVHMKSNSYAYC